MKNAQQIDRPVTAKSAGDSPEFWISKGFSLREAAQLSKDAGLNVKSKIKRRNDPSETVAPPHQTRTENCFDTNNYFDLNGSKSIFLEGRARETISPFGLGSRLNPKNFGNMGREAKRLSRQQSIDESLGSKWMKLVLCGLGTLVCSAALIAYGSISAGNSVEAKFWASLIVISSSILLALPFYWWTVRSWIQKCLGLSIIAIGYTTMHASITTAEKKAVHVAIAGTAGVRQLEESITDIEQRLKPTRDAIARLDPVEYRTLIARMQSESKPLEDELVSTRKELAQARDKALLLESSGADTWSFVEWMRRLMLEPLNILCLHGFIEAWPQAINALRRRRIRLAQVAT
jgi:hypothetical protein